MYVNSRIHVHVQNTANVAVLLLMHIGKHLFHARSDTIHLDKKSVKLLEYCSIIPDAYMNGYQQYCRYFNSIHVTHWKGHVYTLSKQ